MSPREELEGIVQRLTQQQQLEPDDVTFESVEVQEGSFCVTVLISVLGNINFTGDICSNEEDACRSAALAALAEFAAVGQAAERHLPSTAGGDGVMEQAAPVDHEQVEPGDWKKRTPQLEMQGNGHLDGVPKASKRPRVPPPPPPARVPAPPATPPPPAPSATPPPPPARHRAGSALQPPLPVGPCGPPPSELSSPLLPSDMGPCKPVGRGAPLVRPSPLFQKRPNNSAVGANAKGELNEFLSKLLGRPLTKEDLPYDITRDTDGFIAKLVVPCMGNEEYTGKACSKRKEAEHSAAAVAMAALQSSVPGQALVKTAVSNAKIKPKLNLPPHDTASAALPAHSPKSPGEDISELQEWQQTRLEPLDENDSPDSQSLDLWYGQVCLLCLVICPKSGYLTHAAGQKHQKRFQTFPMKKRLEIPRPPTEPNKELLPSSDFLEIAGWASLNSAGDAGSVLIVGEMDFSFSLAVAGLRPEGSFLVATSYLEEHDPAEPEVYPSGDAERESYSRRTLPAMNGALSRNLQALEEHGAEVRYGVDAMRLESTLKSQGIDGIFDHVVFPFPRASLQRAGDPRNSRLLRNFFLSVVQDNFVIGGGTVQLVMLGSQYEEWDVACMALEAGLLLTGRVSLPLDFYQPREMSGKPWTPKGAELLNFSAAF